jgi:hypothetical protein
MRGKIALFMLVALLAVSFTVAEASNMGFKITYNLTYTITGKNWVGLPYNTAVTNASDLKADAGAACTEVDWFDEVTSSLVWYTGGRGSTNFAVTPGVSYQIIVNANSPWVVVGSHDPAASVGITYTITGKNWTSVPYHTTSGNAANLMAELLGDCPGSVNEIDYFDETTSTLVWYTGGRGSTNFTTDPGRGIQVQVNALCNWTPEHY